MVICNGRFRVQYEFCAEQLFDAVLYTIYWAGFRNMGNHYFAFENLGCD